MSDPAGIREPSQDLTSVHVRRALDGDDESRTWVVEHFTPLLQLQAGHRLRGIARRLYDPEDLVQDVWAIALPRMPQLEPRNGRWTPVLVSFLSTTLLHRVNKALTCAIRDAGGDRGECECLRSVQALAQIPDEISQLVSRIAQRELCHKLRECIDTLSDRDREVLVLHGIEQLSTREVAGILGEKHETIYMRYRRALQRLKEAFPASVFAELA